MSSWLEAEREAYFPGVGAFRQRLLESLLAEYVRLAVHAEHTLIDRTRAYVRAHLGDPFTLEDLAKTAGLSRFYFTRAYKRLTGLSPMQDARRIRVEEARKLILSTGLGLKEIAPRVGLANQYHLSRLLKRHAGAGARELRQRPRG